MLSIRLDSVCFLNKNSIDVRLSGGLRELGHVQLSKVLLHIRLVSCNSGGVQVWHLLRALSVLALA